MHPDMRVKHGAYGHSFATLLISRGFTTVSHNCRLTFAKQATVVVAVSSAVHTPTNYTIKYII
jgi:hypothetical protein